MSNGETVSNFLANLVEKYHHSLDNGNFESAKVYLQTLRVEEYDKAGELEQMLRERERQARPGIKEKVRSWWKKLTDYDRSPTLKALRGLRGADREADLGADVEAYREAEADREADLGADEGAYREAEADREADLGADEGAYREADVEGDVGADLSYDTTRCDRERRSITFESLEQMLREREERERQARPGWWEKLTDYDRSPTLKALRGLRRGINNRACNLEMAVRLALQRIPGIGRYVGNQTVLNQNVKDGWRRPSFYFIALGGAAAIGGLAYLLSQTNMVFRPDMFEGTDVKYGPAMKDIHPLGPGDPVPDIATTHAPVVDVTTHGVPSAGVTPEPSAVPSAGVTPSPHATVTPEASAVPSAGVTPSPHATDSLTPNELALRDKYVYNKGNYFPEFGGEFNGARDLGVNPAEVSEWVKDGLTYGGVKGWQPNSDNWWRPEAEKNWQLVKVLFKKNYGIELGLEHYARWMEANHKLWQHTARIVSDGSSLTSKLVGDVLEPKAALIDPRIVGVDGSRIF